MKGEVWLYQGMSAWHFLTLPKKEAREIKECFGAKKRGWGSLRVIAKIGKTEWKTSIFPDKRADSYLLPLKADVRKKENVREGDRVFFRVSL